MVVVMGFEEGFNLFGEEGEEFFGCFGCHEVSGDGDFGLGKGEGGVAVQLDRADSEVCSSEVDC